jgi:luciferase-like monooxygenase
MKLLKKLEDEMSTWPHIWAQPHRFGGKEFLFGSAEVGRVHTGGVVDIPFPRSVHDALLAGGLAEEHRWVPNSGWITFHVRSDEDLRHARCLMRLSYLRYALKTAPDACKLLEQESQELRLGPEFRSLLEKFVPVTARQVLAEPLA